MNNEIVKQFAKELSVAPDDAHRKALVARAMMLAMQEADPEQFEPPISTLGEYLARPIEVPPILVSPSVIVRGGLTATIGRAGKGKTVMNLNRIMKWTAGKPWFDSFKDKDGEHYLAPPKPLKILVIENEGAAGMFHQMVGIMLNAPGFMTEKERELVKENMLIWGDGGYSDLKFDDPQKFNGVKAGVEKYQPDIVFVEPFRGLWRGEENSATDMQVVIDAMMEIGALYDCGVLLAHHERKAGTGEDGEKMSAARGSGVLEGAATTMENFESVKAGQQRELSWSKSRHLPSPAPMRLKWEGTAWWYNHIPDSALKWAILEFIQEHPEGVVTVSETAEAMDEKMPKVRKELNELKEDGKVKTAQSATAEGGGSTGVRYRLNTSDPDANELEL